MKLLELMLKIDGSWVVLDTNDDLSIPITYNISDIRDISTLNSSFTKSIKIPMSDRNMKYLSNIAQITSDGIINVNKKIPARVFSEGLLQLDGIIQFRKIISEDGVDYVESVIYAAGDSIFQTLGELELRDLDWSGLNHNWTRENIIATWTADWKTGYYYPLIDYGWDWTINDINKPDDINKRINTEHFYPATYVKYMIDRIFAENSWTYTSDFFNTDTFKNLVIPFNSGQMKPAGDFVTNRQFRASLTTDQIGAANNSNLDSRVKTNGITPQLNNETAPNGDPSNQWNTTTFTFTQPSTGLQAQQFVLDLEWIPGQVGGDSNTRVWSRLYVNWYRGGATTPFWTNTLNFFSWNLITDTRFKHQFSTPVLGGDGSNFQALQNNETLECRVFLARGTTIDSTFRTEITIYKETKLFNVIENKIMRQQEIDYNSVIPVMKQRDFLLNITKMFNLFIIPDPNDEGNFLIEPRDEYYKGGTIKDWTKKIHKGGIREWNILGELQNKELLFTYKDDKDILNTDYKAKTARTWGEHKHIVDNDFIKGQKKVEVTFSPTVISNIPGANDMVIPKIMMSTTPGVKSIQTGPRILLKKLMPNSQPWYFGAQVQNNYPYAGHFDDPLFGDVDINFGQTLGAYYIDNPIITGNLYNMYWESYIDEITDKDSKILMAEFNLNPYDIFTFKFNDIIQIEDLYYRINKIIDYDPNIRELTKVELIKIKDVRIKRVAGKPSSGTTGGGGGFNPGGIKPTVKPTLQPDGPGGGPGPGTGGTKPVRDKINMLGDSGSSENQSFSRGTIQSGYDLVVGVDSEGAMMTGERNTIGDNSKNSTIIGGSDNIIAPSAPNNTLMNTQNSEIQTAVEGSTILGGEYHYIGASNSHIIGGTGNTIESDAVGTTLIGVTNFTATQSNTTYIGGDTIYITGDTIISGSVSGVGLPDVLMENNTTGGYNINLSLGDKITSTNSIVLETQGIVGFNGAIVNGNVICVNDKYDTEPVNSGTFLHYGEGDNLFDSSTNIKGQSLIYQHATASGKFTTVRNNTLGYNLKTTGGVTFSRSVLSTGTSSTAMNIIDIELLGIFEYSNTYSYSNKILGTWKGGVDMGTKMETASNFHLDPLLDEPVVYLTSDVNNVYINIYHEDNIEWSWIERRRE